MRILIIAPHPDDEILGCGGVIAKYIKEGNEVKILVMTRGTSELYPDKAIDEVRQEARDSHKYLGVSETIFFDFPAPVLDQVPSYKMSMEISKVINSYRPEIVYVPHRGDIHKDHRMVFESALVSMRPINNCSVREIYAYETLSETEWAPPFGDDVFIPNVFVDITRYLEIKKQAMKYFNSQLRAFPSSRSLTAIDSLSKFRGVTVNVEAAEAFMLIRKIN